jgi:hypothetical protein
MPSSQQIAQLVILRVKEGVNLENVTSSNPNPEVQAFIKLTDIIKAQRGFIRQFWVYFSGFWGCNALTEYYL